jgi:peptidyl-prolyl cis-trans isomerase C
MPFSHTHYIVGGLIGLILVAFLVTRFTGGPDDLETSDSMQRPMAGGDQDPAIVIVNGSALLRSQVLAEAVAQNLVSEQEELDLKNEDIKTLLDDLISQKLLAQEARRQKIDEQPEALTLLELAEDYALSELLLRKQIEEEISDVSLHSLYAEQVELVTLSEEVRARHILVELRAEAEAVIGRLESGEDFGDVAKDASVDPGTAPKGGELGYFTRDEMVKEFSDVAFSTEIGQTSKPFHSQFGWHVLKVEDRRQQLPPSFDELKPQMVRYQSYRIIQKLIDDLREDAKIDYVLGTPPSS